MSTKLIAINIGNTRIHLGLFSGGELISQHRCTHREIDSLGEALGDLGGETPPVYIASVHDEALHAVTRWVARTLGGPVMRIEDDVPVSIGRQVDRKAQVGEDRLLNAAAAFDRFKQACIVVDAGTAVTVDFVDGQGTFHGGAILPGLRMQGAALHEKIPHLPQVDPDPDSKPREPIGHNTVEAIRSGLFHGLRGAVRELVEKYAEFYGAYPKVIATGGDAAYLFEHYDLVESIHPELTLEGIAITHRHAMENENSHD